ncbi:hypothetical protein JH26_08925 [Microvirga sp. BSC39]|nr:hypothetical protein JH26_08925 [Microvirga sp. BSC39]
MLSAFDCQIAYPCNKAYWRIFADHPRICSDRQIRGWMPLLRSYDNYAMSVRPVMEYVVREEQVSHLPMRTAMG